MHNNHISILDGIRGLAIIFVLFYHIGIAKSGFLGVDIFFILSGFLISMVIYIQIEKNKFSFKSFFDSYNVNFFNKFEKTINSIISSNKDVSIILPTPVMTTNPPLFIAREYKLFGNLLNQKELCISKNKFELESSYFIRFVDVLSNNYSRINIVNLYQYLLQDGKYCSIYKNELFYRDDNHLTNSFGMKYSKKIVSQILNKD